MFQDPLVLQFQNYIDTLYHRFYITAAISDRTRFQSISGGYIIYAFYSAIFITQLLWIEQSDWSLCGYLMTKGGLLYLDTPRPLTTRDATSGLSK